MGYLRLLPLLGFCVLSSASARADDLISEQARDAYLAGARIYEDELLLRDPSQVAAKDVARAGGAFTLNQEVRCEFVAKAMSGTTPKFSCKLPNGDAFKFKYFSKDENKNGEIFSTPIASRLLWALGFPADLAYQVNVTCDGCPEDPWKFTKNEESLKKLTAADTRGSRRFWGAIYKKYSKTELAADEKGGWPFKRLDRASRSTRAQRDALRLLMAFIQHGDSKGENQSLVCARKLGADGRCADPVMYVKDLGCTFGYGGGFLGSDAKVKIGKWQSQRIWREDSAECLTKLDGSAFDASLRSSKISEEGRAFLADRLNALTDAQIAALFESAQIERRAQKFKVDGQERPATVADWVRVFQDKRAQINARRCAP